nr:hypothetical protein [uncultured Actinoplanes sp.]
MTPARSLAASVVALGFASTLTTPVPALAAPAHLAPARLLAPAPLLAPASCTAAETYAAQSGAELLRIDELEVRKPPAERPATKTESHKTTDRVLAGIDPTSDDPDDSDTISEGIGMFGSNLLDLLDVSEIRDPDATSLPFPESAGTGGQGGGSMDSSSTLADIGLGESRTAMISHASVNSAGYARVLDGRADGKAALSDPVLQQAPPSHAKAATRKAPAAKVGPLTVGKGEISAHARWEAAMGCGRTPGEASRADAALNGVSLLGSGRRALVRVPQKIASRSSTSLRHLDGEASTVAEAGVTAGRIDLAGGKVRLKVLSQPQLTACMSATGTGEISYTPATIEVSGEGVPTRRLSTAGDHVDVTVSSLEAAAFPGLDTLRKGTPLPLPVIPGFPKISSPHLESAPAVGPAGGTKIRISLGEVRQARKGHAIAAKATAIKVAILQSDASDSRASEDGDAGRDAAGRDSGRDAAGRDGAGRDAAGRDAAGRDAEGYDGEGSGGRGSGGEDSGGQKADAGSSGDSDSGSRSDGRRPSSRDHDGYDGKSRPAVSLTLGFGLLEAAALAPESRASGVSPAGAGGGLPITGPRVDLLAAAGVGLLAVGAAAVFLSMRRRRSQP